MKLTKWISLFLIAVLTVTMIGGCKTAEKEESASVDSWVEVKDQEGEKSDQTPNSSQGQTPQKPIDPSEKGNNAVKDPAKEGTEEPGKTEKPEEQTPGEETPSQGETNGETEDQTPETDPEPVQKESSGTGITFLSQNVRHSGTRLCVKGDGIGNSIYNRMRRFKSLVQAHDPDVIFYSEARVGAIEFLTEDPYFSSKYTVHYRYENGVQAEPLLYKKAKYQEVEGGFFWLSETPDRPSSYDGGETISSWMVLKDKTTGEQFYCVSTHFRPGGHMAVVVPSMEQYLKIAEEMDADEYAFFGGDFNVGYRTENYNLMMDWDRIVDLRDVAMNMKEDALCTLGGMLSGHNLTYDKATDDPSIMPTVSNPLEIGKAYQIDYVMAKPNPHMAVDYYGFDYTVYDYLEDGVQKGHISDHYGLVVKVRIGTDADYSQYQCEHDYGDNPIYF